MVSGRTCGKRGMIVEEPEMEQKKNVSTLPSVWDRLLEDMNQPGTNNAQEVFDPADSGPPIY